jgi:hypothetical protein
MPGLVPGIHVFLSCFTESPEDVDGRDKPGHDESMFHQHIVYDYGGAAMFLAENPRRPKNLRGLSTLKIRVKCRLRI